MVMIVMVVMMVMLMVVMVLMTVQVVMMLIMVITATFFSSVRFMFSSILSNSSVMFWSLIWPMFHPCWWWWCYLWF